MSIHNITPENFEEWMHLSGTDWFTAEELEKSVLKHQYFTDAQMRKSLYDVERKRVRFERCERIVLEEKLNEMELKVWLPYRGLLTAQYLNYWLQIRPYMIQVERCKRTHQRRLDGKSNIVDTWPIFEQGILAERFSLWLCNKFEQLQELQLPTINFGSKACLVNRSGQILKKTRLN